MSFFVVSATPCENIENYHKYCDATSEDPFVDLANAEKCASLRKAKRTCYENPDSGHDRAIRNAERHIENLKRELRHATYGERL